MRDASHQFHCYTFISKIVTLEFGVFPCYVIQCHSNTGKRLKLITHYCSLCTLIERNMLDAFPCMNYSIMRIRNEGSQSSYVYARKVDRVQG